MTSGNNSLNDIPCKTIDYYSKLCKSLTNSYLKFRGGKKDMLKKEQWNGFKGRLWKEEINVRDFIQNNYKPYYGDESF